MAHKDYMQLPRSGEYYVNIDTTLAAGSMTVGEAVLKGATSREILFTSYICHPSMANNELSGPLAVAFLFKLLKEMPSRKYTYRFVIGPETLGALYYLDKHGAHLRENLDAGLVITCCGDAGNLTFKKSRVDSYLNRLIPHLLKFYGGGSVREFKPVGSDERQYCSPGFNLPVGCLTRTMYGEYKEYHTSKDDKSVISFEALENTVTFLLNFVRAIELESKYVNLFPDGEPQLGKRGLYPTLMSDLNRGKALERLMYLLNFSDGNHWLVDIAERMNEPILSFEKELSALLEKELLRRDHVKLHAIS